MAGVNFIEALETLKSMFPELDTVTLRDALDSKGGHMESAVEELLQISRRQRGVGGGGGWGGGWILGRAPAPQLHGTGRSWQVSIATRRGHRRPNALRNRFPILSTP